MRIRAAIDIGGTKMAVGLVNGNQLIAHTEVPTDAEAGPENAVRRLASALNQLLANEGLASVQEIGIASTGPVNTATGRIENPYSLAGWETIDFPAKLAERCDARVVIDHDVAAALLGLLQTSGLKDCCVVLAMFGTGVGASVSINGEIYQNRQPYHPEFGSFILDPNGRDGCCCGRPGCVESLLSGPALHQRSLDAGFENFTDACQDPSEKGLAFHKQIRNELRMFANFFALTFQPDFFFIGGGAIKAAPELFQEAIASVFREDHLYVAPAEVKIIDDRSSSLIGAAALCDQQQAKKESAE